MTPWRIERTDTADAMLNRIILFVAEQFGTEVALEKLDEIETQVNLLALNPEMGVLPKYMLLRRQGYRVLILKKDLVFYKVDEGAHTIIIYAFFDSREDYLSILMGM